MATDEVEVPESRCGYPTKGGAPCRNRVTAAGKICRVHQKPALLDRILKRTPGSGRQSGPRPQ